MTSVDPVSCGEVVETARRLVVGTDCWLGENAARFDPLVGQSRRREVRQKAFCELAMYLDSSFAHGDDGPAACRQLLTERATTPDYYRQFLRHPRQFPHLAYPLAALSRQDDLPARVERLFERTATLSAARQPGRPVSRQLDYWHTCLVYGIRPDDFDPQALLEHGYTSCRINAVDADIGAAYGITHELLFYHNLGNDRAEFPDEPLSYEAPDTILGLLFRFLAEDHVDAVVELLFVGVLQRQVPPGLVRYVLGWLADRVGGDGALRFPTDDPLELRTYTGVNPELWEDNEVGWRCHYHPTIVFGMLCRTVARDWHQIRRESPARNITHDAVDDQLDTLGTALSALADYSLERGSEALAELADTPIVSVYDDVVDHGVEFLQRQLYGQFPGSWVDERGQFTDGDRTREAFRREILDPLDDRIETTLEAVRSDESDGE
ncbi:hypothetical protein [Halobaculum sp. MBLA0143]|uniref:DUF6895 family protein n=1 Tax=Halobaculum sp. MBLA0143 TaxID=3079933 RepID=UPI00352502CB